MKLSTLFLKTGLKEKRSNRIASLDLFINVYFRFTNPTLYVYLSKSIGIIIQPYFTYIEECGREGSVVLEHNSLKIITIILDYLKPYNYPRSIT